MTPEEIEACWKDPRNRRWGVYYCKADPRVIVPKSIKWMGWTINAAQPSAIPVVLILLAILTVPVSIAASKGAGIGIMMATVALSITVVSVLSAFASSTKRWKQ